MILCLNRFVGTGSRKLVMLLRKERHLPKYNEGLGSYDISDEIKMFTGGTGMQIWPTIM